MKIRVFLADDHAVMRDGLRALLEASGEVEIVGEAGSGHEALEAIQKLKPDVVLMDISMPGLDGVQVTEFVHERLPGARIVMLSMVADAEIIYRALRAGAFGYLVKASAGREVVEAVRTVHRGKRFLSDQVSEKMVEQYASEVRAKSPLESLSGRERQVLQLLAEGRSAAAIGGLISISPRTVETYRERIKEKLGIKDQRELILFAVKHGILPQS